MSVYILAVYAACLILEVKSMSNLSRKTKASVDDEINQSPILSDTVMDDELLRGLIVPPSGYCFHCGDSVPNPPFYAEVLGEQREMCCMGCQLAAQSIVEAGLEQYYLDRSQINRTASLPSELHRLQAYDHEEVKAQFVYAQDGYSVAELSVNNLRCAACTWLIETRLYELKGVHQCQVNLTNQRMRVIWDEKLLPISEILAVIGRIGYDAKPYRQDTHEAMLARHNKQMLIRLGISALGAMQAMMFAVALYFGEYSGMMLVQRDFLRWVSLFVSVPVFFYAGIPFFVSAWTALKAKQVNMDVPVSIALLVTFFASLYATITGQGETYYDSVSMFIFFLLAGRYVEHNARLKAASMANDLVVIEPVLVKRLATNAALAQEVLEVLNTDAHQNDLTQIDSTTQHAIKTLIQSAEIRSANQADDKIVTITKQSLQIGDIVLIDAGMEVVSDGIVLSPSATVSQSLLTGESDLLIKHQGDIIVGGAQNDSQPFVMLVIALAEDSQIGLIDRLMNRAMSEKPKLAEQADRLARWFVARVLVLSAVVFVAWYFVNPTQAIWATVAVLVATCPCALSLATPIALTVATNRLASFGFLPTRGHTLQTLAEITHVAFDKTGTLTYGQPNLLYIEHDDTTTSHNPYSQERLLSIAASLEVGSRHPIAHALLSAAYQKHLPTTESLQHYPAGGVQAIIESDTYRIGHWHFACQKNENEPLPFSLSKKLNHHHASSMVVLSKLKSMTNHNNENNTNDNKNLWQPLAYFYFNDKLRDDAKFVVQGLKDQGIITLMLTGDPNPEAIKIANQLGMAQAYYGLSPTDKVHHIQSLQSQSAVVLMVGDGINDAPVLAAANVSASISGAADLAQVSSDAVILSGNIGTILDAKRIADKTQRIIKQNFRWAVGYNTIILLPAAFGYVPPWLAAIGMSLSSFLVVMNAMRLKRG